MILSTYPHSCPPWASFARCSAAKIRKTDRTKSQKLTARGTRCVITASRNCGTDGCAFWQMNPLVAPLHAARTAVAAPLAENTVPTKTCRDGFDGSGEFSPF